MAIIYDTHAHLDYPAFSNDLAAVIERARAAGVSKIISLGTDLAGSARCVRIAEGYDCVFAGAGWHPTHVMQDPPDDLRPALNDLARNPRVVAIGETGLDFHRRPEGCASDAEYEHYKQTQVKYFHQHIEVAIEHDLPCVIHQRDSFDAVMREIKPYAGKLRGVFHCFSESIDALRQVLDFGMMVSYTGILTFQKGQNVRDALTATPMDRFMFESDSPFLVPEPYRGKEKRCEPAFLREVAARAADVKNRTVDELSAATCQNARRLFSRIA